jgi:hypothetical protein
MRALIYPLLILAGIGSLAMLAIHLAALFGIAYPFEHFLRFLAPGLFIVWLPTILVMGRLTKDFKQKEIWHAALRGCPQWMRRTVWVIFGYAWVGFFALPFLYGGGMESVANKARVLSAVLLALYAISVAVLYSATQAKHLDDARYCLNGHRMSPLANFCEECGAAVRPSLQGL